MFVLLPFAAVILLSLTSVGFSLSLNIRLLGPVPEREVLEGMVQSLL